MRRGEPKRTSRMRSPDEPAQDSPGWWRLEWCLPLALAAAFVTVGVRATPFEHSPLALGVIGVLYLGLALTLHLVVRFAVRAGAVFGLAAALALAVVPAAQLRIDAELLQRKVVWLGFVAALGVLYFGLLRSLRPRDRRAVPRELALAYLAFAALAGATALAARASEEVRWHLLKHHRLFGTPLYAFAPRSLKAERDGLWTRQGRLSDPSERAEPASEPPVLFRRPPHVVFVLLDTLRADALAALGGPPNVMPRLNERAAAGVLFEDVHTNASWTRASCASIFTGLLPEEHGAARFHERLSEHWSTLPEQLSAAGYETAAFIANWVQVGRDTGFAQGFAPEDFHELASGDEILARAGADAAETEVRSAYARAEAVNAAVLEWLASDARDPYRPAFLYLHYLDPHSPYLEPPEPGTLQDPRERKRGLYRQQLRYLDRKLEELFTALDSALSGPKIVIVTSDHGEEFYEHDDWGHGHSLYREVLHVPLLVFLPDGRAGRVAGALEGRDLYALTLDLVRDPELDLAAWGETHARSVRYSSQYLDRVEDARPDKKWTGLRRLDAGPLALIWSAYGSTLELYDRASDPGELANRIDARGADAGRLGDELCAAVRFWSAPTVVERSERDLAFLRELGYAGGIEGGGQEP
jgi:arylsulfatase A-like enzyme